MRETERESGAAARPGGPARRGGALAVAAGILSSRLAGFVRQRLLGHFLGIGPHADVVAFALRAPNFLQNLLGDQALSAAFIPVYARLVREGRREAAGRFAGAILGLLLALAGGIVLAGLLLARPFVALFSPGFLADGAAVAAGRLALDRGALAVEAVRWTFPRMALLLLSAWALAILNSHRRFFLPYFAPVAWNAAIVAGAAWGAMAAGGPHPSGGAGALERIVIAVCAGALAGGALQFLVQLPAVVREVRGFRLSLGRGVPEVGGALRAFGPVLAGRGVVQLSSWLDLILASLLLPGALSALGPAQMLYLLPVSLFGVSAAAAALPEMATAGSGGGPDGPAPHLDRALAGVAFFALPATAVLLAFSPLVVGAFFRSGRFGEAETRQVAAILLVLAVGLPAATLSRSLQNAFYALRETRWPARVAVFRVVAGTAVAIPLMFWLDRFPVPGAESAAHRLGAAGLAAGAALGAWVELAALSGRLRRALPGWTAPWGQLLRTGGLAALPVAPAWWLAGVLPAALHVATRAVLVVGLYGALYLGLSAAAGTPAARAALRRMYPFRRSHVGEGG
ncbi:MAG: murein biosynthesis integral membrane protein MurJ [Thermoanaerobaculia bacterium]|nr:murein biosynthesis integral membrane protein MurJ [Thermoanaerobaculia bacterium]